MINTQLGRRSLPPAQRLAVMDKFKKKIQEQAKENMSIGGSSDKKGSPNGETLIKKQTHTDKELAKMAGVGAGTVARYDAVMKATYIKIKSLYIIIVKVYTIDTMYIINYNGGTEGDDRYVDGTSYKSKKRVECCL